ncbi:hypothetical protein ACQJBY_036221 [Aegilops geniculata]
MASFPTLRTFSTAPWPHAHPSATVVHGGIEGIDAASHRTSITAAASQRSQFSTPQILLIFILSSPSRLISTIQGRWFPPMLPSCKGFKNVKNLQVGYLTIASYSTPTSSSIIGNLVCLAIF